VPPPCRRSAADPSDAAAQMQRANSRLPADYADVRMSEPSPGG
jgi:hypothetical protein